MDSNNHFNYGNHPSPNSGLKLSSGESLYTNGSSVSFPQQKNLNGEMNVNGITTVLGSSVPASHPPSAPYPHVSSRQQSSVGYDYLWGGHPQYGPSVGPSPGHGMHQKQTTPAMAQPQSHHFQGQGQYQLNGVIESPHQPPVAGPANVPLTGSQYWNKGNSGLQQVSYDSRGMFGPYQSQTLPGITPSQHQQQQQSLQQAAHQPSQQHLHSHRQHHHQQLQQYSLMPNGMPFYQHQHPSPQHQQQQPQGHAQMMPPTAQNATPPHSSPQHHGIGRGSSSSPLPVGASPTPIKSPSLQETGSPKSHSRERSPHPTSVGLSSPVHGHSRESVQEIDLSYNSSERAPVAQRSPKAERYQPKPLSAHVSPQRDFCYYSDQPGATSPARDPVVLSHSQCVSSPRSASGSSAFQTKASSPPEVSVFSGSPTSSPGPQKLSLFDVESSPPQMTTPPKKSMAPSVVTSSRLSSPPSAVQCRRPSTSFASAGFKHAPEDASSSLLASSSKLSTPPTLTESISRITKDFLDPPVLPPSESLVHPAKPALALTDPGPSTTVCPPALVSIPSYSAPKTTLKTQVAHGSKLPLTPGFTDAPEGHYEKPAPPRPMPVKTSKSSTSPGATHSQVSTSGPTSTLPSLCLSASAPSSQTPSVVSGVCEPSPMLRCQTYTPLAAASAPPGLVSPAPRLTQHSLTVRPLLMPPPGTTQATKTAPISSPPALVPAPRVIVASSRAVQDFKQPPPVPATPPAQVQSEHRVVREDSKAVAQLDSSTGRASQVELSETKKTETHSHKSLIALPENYSQTFHPNIQKPDSEKQLMKICVVSEAEDFAESAAVRKSPQPKSTRPHLSDEQSFDTSSHTVSYFGDDSACSTPSRLHVSSVTGGDGSFLCDSTQFYSSSCNSSFPVEDSREDTVDLTREGEPSEADTTQNADRQENGSQVQEPSVDPSDVSNSHSFVSSHPVHQGSEAEWEPRGYDAPDSARHFVIKPPANDATPPSFRIKHQNFMAFSTPAEDHSVHPLQPVTDQTPGKPRRPRAPKIVLIKTTASEEGHRRSRGQRPKVVKIKLGEEGGAKEEGARGRKRKKSFKVEDQETSGLSEGTSLMQEVDPITAAIEAVLANASTISTAGGKPKKMKRVKKQVHEGNESTQKQDAETTADDVDDNDEDSSTAGESNRRRVATEEQVQFPLMHGWRREIRVKKTENRMKGETWYYTPCGRRMKQFPEIIKYLKKHSDSVVTREHFSFSPRMPVGDFYEERETPEGMKWFLLANEEVPSMIMAITGRRGRPPNPDKEKPCRVRGQRRGQTRRPGRPPKFEMVDLLSKVDAKLLKRLQTKETLTEEEKEKLSKIKKKMKRKARMKRREDLKIKKMNEEKKKAKLVEDVKLLEVKAESTDPAAPQLTDSDFIAEPKKPGRRRSLKGEATSPVQQTAAETVPQGVRVASARSKAKALARAQAEAEAAAQAALAAKRAAERRALAQKRLEERKRQQLIAEELKKPTEDMCLTDHKLLPELSRIPGLVLSGTAFAHCLAVVEFLHGYGKVIGLDVPKDIPSLATLQEGLLGLGDSQGKVQDLLIKLVEAALHDPGLPSYYQSVKILGEKLVDLGLTRSTVSEALRIYLESHGYETEVCNSLRTKTFHALPPDTKAAILGFLAEELNSSNIVTSDIDNTLENMTTYRKNKWIIEGKLRKLKVALARRTGRSEEELCFEERRRSARVAEEENLSLEEGGLTLERGSRRARKEEPKLSDNESPANASIPELERQIDKLTKRQAFFRKKLLQSSHSMRSIMLGQDRYRRRYLALPHLGGILVEGPEELLTSGDVLVAEVPVAFLKKEPKVEETPTPTTPPPPPPPPSESSATPAPAQFSLPEEDPLPGTASLMSTQRGRGRPRKIKPEVELHLRTAKIRRRRRSSIRSVGEEGPGSPNGCLLDLTQAAFKSWLSQSQEAVTNGTCSAEADGPTENLPEETVKEKAEKQGQWFNLLPKQPCDENSLSEPQAASTPSSPPKLLPQTPSALPALAAPLTQPEPLLPSLDPADAAPPDITHTGAAFDYAPPPAPVAPPPAAPTTPARPTRRRRRGSRGSSPARRGARGAAAKRRGRPANSAFQELEQQFFTQLVVKPIPASMTRGWWWIKDPEELYTTLQSLHPRGVREKVLHKHLAKHMESLAEICTKPISDPLFEVKPEKKEVLLEALQQPWQVQEKAVEMDVSALQWVEDLEQRVVAADLHLKAPPQGAINETDTNTETPMAEFQPYTIPDPDSTRDDLQYYEHDVDPRDDWIVRTKKEWSGLPRIATHPLDLAVLRLANLERNIERRYLKEPLWNPAEVMRLAPLTPTPGEEHPMDVISLESEITSRLRTWRQALDRCRSAPQICLCLLQLEKAIAWERSVTKVTCQVCRKGDDDEHLLLCDSCDRGCHMYCLKPKITQVPEGDWFCPACVAKDEGDLQRSCKKRSRTKKRRYEDDSSEDEATRRRSGGMATRHKETATPPSSSRSSGEGGGTKRRRMTTRNQPDLTFCEIILMEMEAHADAWPFLEPVNPRLVPGYRRIIKNPMDFLTMREKLLQGVYCSCDEFSADAQLVFNNCELFNEDTSEVGTAGHSMRRFFESRWAEFYSNKDK
ncbi:bromodomain adjacent to zinc finger domain protein 2A isoform X1 [Nothobranchius furzeri]|nr:transcript variant X2 [Nothobranchius furzeri]KAF7210169.1 transcript variant X1 [Nothobranchius furzeri]